MGTPGQTVTMFVASTPRMTVPDGACDCHVHLYGPAACYPFAPDASFIPPDRPLAEYMRVFDALGLSRAVIVHGVVHGTDCRVTLDAIAGSGGRFKGIAVISPDISDDDLQRLDAGGMTGVRMTTVVKSGVDFRALERIAARIHQFGWHVELHLGSAAEMVELAPRLGTLPTSFVIDHVGRVRGSEGVDHPGFQALLALARDDERCWVKLSSFYRLSDSGAPDYADMVAPGRALVEACPDRLVWGSNWPHPDWFENPPDDGRLLDWPSSLTTDAAVLHGILVENPARLYGWAR